MSNVLLDTTKAVYRHISGSVGRRMARAEAKHISKFDRPEFTPVFVTGVPRSGSTLVYQAICHATRVCYFTNLADRFADCPVIISRLLGRLSLRNSRKHFESDYGETRGYLAPSAGRHIWARWFPADQSFVGAGALPATTITEIRQLIAAYENLFQLPFVNKAQGHCVRLLALNEIFPNALIVRVRRNAVPVAKSILKGREEYFGDSNHWFSVKPRGYVAILDRSPVDQVCTQIAMLERDLNEATAGIGANRVFEIDYETFCRRPEHTIRNFQKFYEAESGFCLDCRRLLPSSFQVSWGPGDSQWCDEQILESLNSVTF